MPVYLDDELTQKAAALRVTKQFLVLTALRQAGYHIADAGIVADKRKVRSTLSNCIYSQHCSISGKRPYDNGDMAFYALPTCHDY
jgi:hypothetical protein